MFAPLRRLFLPRLAAPLRAAEWDGRRLSLALDAGASVALDVDGTFFTEACAGEGRLAFEFPFSPSGHAEFALLPRAGRGGAPLAARPWQVTAGRAGLRAAADAGGAPGLAPLAASQLVPYGVDAAAPDVAIVVPVYDAPALAERCLDAVLAHTSGRARLIVIDDASPDPAVAPLLARYAGLGGVEIVRNATNRGFTASANRGIALAGAADVVLLNADAEVGPNWLTGLRRAAHSGADVGTATAVSDNAGAFSVPELEEANPLPAAWTFAQAARALWQDAGLAYPALPTGNGFCLYIRRAVLDEVGALDESAFPQGYGEENDFCQRAAAAGFRHLIAGNVLVGHARSQSFGEERRRALGAAGMAVLRERWPRYEAEVGRSLRSFERRVLDWRVRRTFAAATAANAPRLRALWLGEHPPRLSGVELRQLRRAPGRVEWLAGGRQVAEASGPPEALARHCWNRLQLDAIEWLAGGDAGDPANGFCARLGIPLASHGAAGATRTFTERKR